MEVSRYRVESLQPLSPEQLEGIYDGNATFYLFAIVPTPEGRQAGHHPMRGVFAAPMRDGALNLERLEGGIQEVEDWDDEIDPLETHPDLSAATEALLGVFVDAMTMNIEA
jgi:hypothetical protein